MNKTQLAEALACLNLIKPAIDAAPAGIQRTAALASLEHLEELVRESNAIYGHRKRKIEPAVASD